ncbi:MAG: prepilin-type N-terminal cleavage/methylation domain-containing protein [Fusobacteria bacterium]|nr:prepilin-type N-terminal cleavage/methylation domain-containing protein [Fusobacteriota bacterium]
MYKNIGKNKKGFTLVELLVVIAILVIIIGIIVGFQAQVIRGQNAKKTAYEIAGFFKTQINKGFNERVNYDIKIDYANRKITLYSNGTTQSVSVLKLSSGFNYTNNSNSSVAWTGSITDEGYMSPNSILIKSKGGQNLYKITISGMYKIKLSDIKIYRATGSGAFPTKPLITLN